MDARDLHRRMISGAHAPGAGTLARALAVDARVDRLGYSRGIGAGSPHHRPVGRRLRRGRAGGFDVRAVRRFPPALAEAQRAELRAAVQEPPTESGIELANWNWKVVHQYVAERYCASLSRSSCLNWLHRLGFAFKRPKKRLVKADGAKREAFVSEYAVLSAGNAPGSGGKIFFADEAHFRGGRRTAGQMGAQR